MELVVGQEAVLTCSLLVSNVNRKSVVWTRDGEVVTEGISRSRYRYFAQLMYGLFCTERLFSISLEIITVTVCHSVSQCVTEQNIQTGTDDRFY